MLSAQQLCFKHAMHAPSLGSAAQTTPPEDDELAAATDADDEATALEALDALDALEAAFEDGEPPMPPAPPMPLADDVLADVVVTPSLVVAPAPPEPPDAEPTTNESPPTPQATRAIEARADVAR